MILSDSLQLEQINIIGGATEVLQFEVRDINGDPLELKSCSIYWTLSMIGDKENPFVIKSSKSAGITIQEGGLFIVEINKEDTQNLKDVKVEHEVIIEQPNGKILRPCYGYIYIKHGSHYENY